jgi:hypothetical protein
MREDSPVLNALKENPNLDLVRCRWCGSQYHQAVGRFSEWGANGFCSRNCLDLATVEFESGNNDWWKTYHPKNPNRVCYRKGREIVGGQEICSCLNLNMSNLS